MCGICVLVTFHGSTGASLVQTTRHLVGLPPWTGVLGVPVLKDSGVLEECLHAMGRRGPSVPPGHVHVNIPGACMNMHAAVLHLRGDTATPQPCSWPPDEVVDDRIWLVWNGEVFRGAELARCDGGRLESPLDGQTSDTIQVCRCLATVFNRCKQSNNLENEILRVFEGIHGPFAAVVFFPAPLSQLWILRDKLGRRSLCILDGGDTLMWCSTSTLHPHVPTKEVPVCGPMILDFGTKHQETCSPNARILSWMQPPSFMSPHFWNGCGQWTPDVAVRGLLDVLQRSVELRVKNQTSRSVTLLFSGGLDSGLLAALLLKVLPSGGILDLVNVAFGVNEFLCTPDRYTALATYRELLNCFPKSDQCTRLLCVNVSQQTLQEHERHILQCIAPRLTHMDFNIGSALYFAARGEGLWVDKNTFVRNEAWWLQFDHENSSQSRCKPPSVPKPAKECHVVEPCSSCRLARKPGCIHEACRLCCLKKQQHLESSTAPCPVHRNTTPRPQRETFSTDAPMRSSCLYVSVERCSTDENMVEPLGVECDCCRPPAPRHRVCMIRASSPVIVVGHGADELFGGYSRYATAALHGGLASFQLEMKKDLERLWERNLGRDDRCISFWGKEARHPFLDEHVIAFVGQLPFEMLVHERGEDKPLLRAAARLLGLTECASRKKRAIQFGTRVTRVTNLDHFSSHRKADGTALYVPLSPTTPVSCVL